jgi:hypothetical protein
MKWSGLEIRAHDGDRDWRVLDGGCDVSEGGMRAVIMENGSVEGALSG